MILPNKNEIYTVFFNKFNGLWEIYVYQDKDPYTRLVKCANKQMAEKICKLLNENNNLLAGINHEYIKSN